MSIPANKLQELLAKAKASKAAAQFTPEEIKESAATSPENPANTNFGMHGELITYNTAQAAFVQLAVSGKSCILVGAAGTGKSTCQRGATQALIQSGRVGVLSSDGHKYLQDGTPGIVVCAFTRRAVNNIRKVLSEDMRRNCITIHKLLEYEPVKYEVIDDEGNTKESMRFEPQRTSMRPLSNTIHTIIFEESSMVSVELFTEVLSACQHDVQFIFIGDIQQLPPVFGSAILGYKMLELPVIELTEVYRQALESPIIKLAHRILSGTPIPATEYDSWTVPNKLRIHPWKKKLSSDLGLLTAAKFFTVALDSGAYNPATDMILIPFNKSFGADELNKYLAQHIAVTNNSLVHEIIAGFNKHYYAVGDKVMYEKEDGVITDIKVNGLYVGSKFQQPSELLDRWGCIRQPELKDATAKPKLGDDNPLDDIDALLDSMSFDDDSGDRVRQASHSITIRLTDLDTEFTINSSADVNNLALGYAMTVHKSQGSEARKVFIIIHQSHSTMIQRELLYTAVTRAREELYIICEPETFTKGILSQKIKGNTIAEKALYFQGKVDAGIKA